MNKNIQIAEAFYKLRKDLEYDKEEVFYHKAKKYFKYKPFFRLEKNGLGPWDSFRDDNAEDSWIDSGFRRGLERDSSFIHDVWMFSKNVAFSACYDLENLKSWFSETEWQTLKGRGFEVKELYLDKDFNDIFFGDNQVLLLKESGRREIVLQETKEYRIKEAKGYDRLISMSFRK